MATQPEHDILSESLWPGTTRKGFDAGRVHQENARPGDFPTTRERGLWLPQVEVSRRGLNAGRRIMTAFALKNAGDPEVEDVEEAVEVLNHTELDDAMGCWLPGQRARPTDTMRHLWAIATFELRVILNPMSLPVMRELQVCETRGCINTRHFDFTYGIPSRTRLVMIDPSDYEALPNGRIRTIWNDTLPTVTESITAYRKLQKKCPPYTSPEKAILTADGMSKIVPNKIGCWCVRSYYTKAEGQDDYGRLRRRNRTDERHRTQGMAHREIWLALGHPLNGRPQLNHLCGHRPCANAWHLEPATHRENMDHQRRMQAAKKGKIPLF